MRCFVKGNRSDEGAAAVEFALVALILFTLLLGIMQFGYLFFQWNEITHAAREGARWAALEYPAGSVATPDTVKYKVWQAAPDMGLTDADITVTPTNPGIDDVGDPATVTVTRNVPIFAPLIQNILGTSEVSIKLTSTATLRIE